MKFKFPLFHSILLITFLGLFGCNQAQNAGGDSGSGIANLAPKAYQEAIQSKPGILLDVRSPEEFASGHLEGAINYNVNGGSFESEIEKLDKSKTIYVYCAVGGRSANAQSILAEKKFPNVINMTGGINQWKSEGLTVVK